MSKERKIKIKEWIKLKKKLIKENTKMLKKCYKKQETIYSFPVFTQSDISSIAIVLSLIINNKIDEKIIKELEGIE